MKVYLLTADDGGSGTYRIREPARVLSTVSGLELTVARDIDVDATRYLDGRIAVREIKVEADVLVTQRVLTQGVAELIRQARVQGMAVVTDIDDDFHNVHSLNVAAPGVDPNIDRWHNRIWLAEALRGADVVTVSTPALLKYAHLEGVSAAGRVIRNRLPDRVLSIRGKAPDTVGWTGTIQTHPRDLARARGAMRLTDVPFNVVGDDTGVASALGTRADQVVLAASWENDIEQYWQNVIDSIGVGIAPLEPSKFNRAKSWLKVAEYAALGIPFVASPTPEYAKVVAESDGGLTASSEKRWGDAVRMVLDQRDEFSARARAWAEVNTLEANVGDWLDAWELARELADKKCAS